MTIPTQTIPEGHKQTEIGIIPNDWDINQLGSVIGVYRGGSPRPIQKYLTNESNGINWIKIGDVEVGAKYIKSTDERITPEGSRYSREVKEGDFLLSNSMSFGRPYILNIDGCIHDGWLVLQNYQDHFDREFLYYVLSSKIILNQYISKASGSSVLNLNKELVLSVLLPRPQLSEQTAIASVLSDIDLLTEKTEKFIEKKKSIKQGTMQELLTGKRRLPGFSEKWMPINMAEKSVLKARIGWQGLTTAEYLDNGDYYLVTGTDFLSGRINWASCCFVDKSRYIQDRNIQLRQSDILLTKDGTIGKVGFIDSLPGPTTLNSGVFVIRPKDKAYVPLFLYYVFTSSIFDDFLSKLQAGSTISHLYQKDFAIFSFMAPKNEEQTAIATVLSDIDAEIDKLELQLAKYKNIKQGMMQNLLTGKIRLIKK